MLLWRKQSGLGASRGECENGVAKKPRCCGASCSHNAFIGPLFLFSLCSPTRFLDSSILNHNCHCSNTSAAVALKLTTPLDPALAKLSLSKNTHARRDKSAGNDLLLVIAKQQLSHSMPSSNEPLGPKRCLPTSSPSELACGQNPIW